MLHNSFLDTFILRKPPDKHELLELLADINDKWYVIGSGLKVDRSVLSGLTASPQDNMYKLDQVIQTWINSTDLVTWETVLIAFERPIINNRNKASKIRKFLLETYQGKYLYATEFTITINYILIFLATNTQGGSSDMRELTGKDCVCMLGEFKEIKQSMLYSGKLWQGLSCGDFFVKLKSANYSC